MLRLLVLCLLSSLLSTLSSAIGISLMRLYSLSSLNSKVSSTVAIGLRCFLDLRF